MKKNIVLVGGGNQAHYTIDVVEKEDKYNIVGIVDSVHDIGSMRYDYPVIGRQENMAQLMKEYDIYGGVISIGDNWIRYRVSKHLKQVAPNFVFVNALHPSTIIGNNVKIGQGVVAVAGCIFNPLSTIGDFTFFGTGAQVEHDCTIEDYASVSAGSMMGGHTVIGRFSAITLGAVIMDRLTIGEHSVIGAGSLVLKDIPNNVVAYGNPCQVIRSREPGDRFLK